MNNRTLFGSVGNRPGLGDMGLHYMWLVLWVMCLMNPLEVYGASITDIQEAIVDLRSDTISAVPASSQRKLLKNLNNALGALENADTMLRVGKRKASTQYLIRAGEYMDNYLRRLARLVGRGDMSRAIAEPLAAEARDIVQLMRE